MRDVSLYVYKDELASFFDVMARARKRCEVAVGCALHAGSSTRLSFATLETFCACVLLRIRRANCVSRGAVTPTATWAPWLSARAPRCRYILNAADHHDRRVVLNPTDKEQPRTWAPCDKIVVLAND